MAFWLSDFLLLTVHAEAAHQCSGVTEYWCRVADPPRGTRIVLLICAMLQAESAAPSAKRANDDPPQAMHSSGPSGVTLISKQQQQPPKRMVLQVAAAVAASVLVITLLSNLLLNPEQVIVQVQVGERTPRPLLAAVASLLSRSLEPSLNHTHEPGPSSLLHPAPAPFTSPPELQEVGGSGITIHWPSWVRDRDKLSALTSRNCLSRENRSDADWQIVRSKSQQGEDVHALASYFHGNQFSKVLYLMTLHRKCSRARTNF